MIYDPYRENQEKASVILSRWRTKRLHTTGYFMGAFLLMLISNSVLNKSHPIVKQWNLDFWLHTFACCFWIRGWYLLRKAKREFVAQMTPEEMDTLAYATTTRMADNDKRDVKLLTKAYQRVYPEREYLRASQSTESGDTLLRAATSTAITPKDQLLRPTNSDNS